ncbi:MAG: FxLYD domain-containing protein [Candidatus Adiutrix sp.]|jgi:hypothetical protein|nr:FxLYD domain-containing protein [Candidatus Adiutrix sp.]
MPHRPARRAAYLAGLLILLAGACAGPEYGLKPPITADVAELAPISLKIEVLDFRWNYTAAGQSLAVSGRVRNNTGAVQRPVFIYAMLFDETGRAVGLGEARVSPDLMPSGGEGSFQLTVKTSRPRSGRKGPIRHLRLLTNARNE